jgi:S-DNA-T family DNA segregation ATPase FtsK/SpoIIIE
MQVFSNEIKPLYYNAFSWYTDDNIMAKKEVSSRKNNSKKDIDVETVSRAEKRPLNPQIKNSIIAIVLFAFTVIIILGAWGKAGVAGTFLYETILKKLLGFGVILVPVFLVIYAIKIIKNEPSDWSWVEYTSSTILTLSSLGFIHIIAPQLQGGGLIGQGIGSLAKTIFDVYAGATILGTLAIISGLLLINEELHIPESLKNIFKKHDVDDFSAGDSDDEEIITLSKEDLNDLGTPVLAHEKTSPVEAKEEPVSKPVEKKKDLEEEMFMGAGALFSETYEFPPTNLLGKSSGKPSVGDIKANANLIKRTLLNFGIDVEMDEVSIGPTVTRYALKPAEGIKLTRILGLKSDLALALAAHPIRIEAPIPGKSLVGIEIPNRTMSNVGLGSLLEDAEFENSPHRLLVALGKGVTGKSYFTNLAKMPHLLIAGTTGSGKSVTVHNLILSLLYRNGPEDLRLIMVDPKRVELTLYNDIPHLLTPVIKEPKKAILALKWAAKEMERRYDLLEKHSCRDIQSYHKNILEPYLEKKGDDKTVDEKSPERMPYIVVFIDELADIMQAYPRELESGIVRLAQMSRAVGIHLVLSTQRPSVNVITGLIKANIPSRLALQVASQIDSRTILDAPGAESLLGKGDMLYQGSDMSKPERMQCANVSEDQVKAVVSFIKKHNIGLPDEISLGETLDDDRSIASANIDDSDDDELYEDARAVVIEAGKASTSYIQRKLKVGYSRAARLIDLLEERGVVGPADGAKPREVMEIKPSHLSTDHDESFIDSESEI